MDLRKKKNPGKQFLLLSDEQNKTIGIPGKKSNGQTISAASWIP
jgi:hypothetical protein